MFGKLGRGSERRSLPVLYIDSHAEYQASMETRDNEGRMVQGAKTRCIQRGPMVSMMFKQTSVRYLPPSAHGAMPSQSPGLMSTSEKVRPTHEGDARRGPGRGVREERSMLLAVSSGS